MCRHADLSEPIALDRSHGICVDVTERIGEATVSARIGLEDREVDGASVSVAALRAQGRSRGRDGLGRA